MNPYIIGLVSSTEPVIAGICVIALLVALTALVLYLEERRRKRNLQKWLRASFGKTPETKWSAEEFESISLFSKETARGRFMIDDTTWNDIDGDRIYTSVNASVSSAGDDVLYAWLRIPSFDREELQRREELITLFASDEAERERTRFTLALFGRKIRMSQYAYIRQLDTADPVNTLFYVLLMCISLVNLALFAIAPAWAVLLLVPNMIFSFSRQMKNNEKIRLYLLGFSSILQMLDTAQELARTKAPCLAPDAERMKQIIASMKPFRAASYLVTSAGGSSGGMGDVILEYLKAFFHVDMLKFNQMLRVYSEHTEETDELYGIMGTWDAAQAAASYRLTMPYYTMPEFLSADDPYARITAEDMVHPLIEDAVPNSFSISGGNLLTGSNASGKSTFLKNTAVCALLAQSIHTVPAKRYEADLLKVLSSMALSDDLAKKESYFIVELKSIRRILAEIGKDEKVLCLIDEVLRGTNTVERIAASSEILRSMVRPNAVILAATHDIELTYLLEDVYTNLHFEEEIADGEVRFDYKLKEGRAVSRNAIALLGVMGFPEDITRRASAKAARFDTTGKWQNESTEQFTVSEENT